VGGEEELGTRNLTPALSLRKERESENLNMSTLPWKRGIIIGASSGIGEALARRLAAAGVSLALVARRGDMLDALASDVRKAGASGSIHTYPHDVANADEVPALFAQMTQELGGVDLVIFASGVMPKIAPNEFNTEKDLGMIAVNFSGAVAWLNEAATRFAAARTGTIVGISSVAADRGRTKNPVYGATKAAFDHYLEALRNRIERHGATVITIKPGPVDTPMTAGLKMPGMVSVDAAADEILAAMEGGVRVAYVPRKWKLVMAVIRVIPSWVFKRMNI
jgi:decaprenylphospho-beta-D-erythro-pentofuranosid-2-ulose 2-reductase